MKRALKQLIDRIKHALPGVTVHLDEPGRTDGHWFVDFILGGHEVVVEWRPEQGFGISSPALEAGYGEGPEEVERETPKAANRVIELLQTRTRTRPPRAVLLRELRALSKLTQEDLAKRLGIQQGAVSRMERRRDMTVSTLKRLIEAMGGELEVLARFPGESIRISQFEDETEASARGQ